MYSGELRGMTSKASVGDNIQYFRGVRGVSLRELADRSGLRQDYINKIEQGECTVNVDEFFRIARALDCQPTELLLWPQRWSEF